MDKRMNAGFEIINSIPVGNAEFVLGRNVKNPNSFVTWECKNKTDYFWGHYTDSLMKATKDLCQRAMDEVLYLEQREAGAAHRNPDSGYTLTATVKYGENCVLIQFPTPELADVLGSIGITQPPERVYLGGYSDIKVHLQHEENRVADALVQLFKDDNSLRMVNEVAKAVFHSDFRVYDFIEKNLKGERYKSVEDVLRDAVDYGKYLKDISKKQKSQAEGRNAEMEIRAMAQEEQKYTYRQSMQIQGQTGSIGYLRGDFGSQGNEFFTTWNDHRQQLKTEEFQAEFDGVMNALRSEEYGLLTSRSKMSSYVGNYPDSGFLGNCGTEYGFRVDTEKHAYLIRCSPAKGDYNFYCFCYVAKWLDSHMEKARQGIRFIDPHYKELFRIPDGGKIVVTSAWGEKSERACRFIDEYHSEIGSNLYHICEFAERMKQNGATYEPAQAEPQKAKNKER